MDHNTIAKWRLLSPNPIKCSSSSSLGYLNYDALFEVLLRLPLDCVHRFKCVSKQWLFLISSPFFIKRYLSFSAPSISDTFLICWSTTRETSEISGLLLWDDEVSNSMTKSIMPKNPTLNNNNTKFFNLDLEFIPQLNQPHQNHLLQVSNDLILFADALAVSQRMYVFNPITKHSTQLPPLKIPVCGSTGFTSDPLLGFTVLHIGNQPTSAYYHPFFKIEVFSSYSTRDWKVFDVPWPATFDCQKDVMVRVVCWKQRFYWAGTNGVVAYDPFNHPHKCDFISLPTNSKGVRAGYGVGAASEGQLRLFFHSHQSFSVWELEVDHNNYSWSLKYDIFYLPLSYEFPSFSPIDEDKVYFVCNHNFDSQSIVILDLKNGSVHRIFELPPHDEFDSSWIHDIKPFVVGSWPSPLQHFKY